VSDAAIPKPDRARYVLGGRPTGTPPWAGKLLMQRAEQVGSAAGCEFVELTSAMDRAEAHAFYRSIGYKPNSLRFRKLLVQ
jgi:ribosomal protein S18 acetylase RimI-like enzyme